MRFGIETSKTRIAQTFRSVQTPRLDPLVRVGPNFTGCGAPVCGTSGSPLKGLIGGFNELAVTDVLPEGGTYFDASALVPSAVTTAAARIQEIRSLMLFPLIMR